MNPDTHITERALGLDDNVSVTVFDVSALRNQIPELDSLPKARQREVVEQLAPIKSAGETHNVTCVGLHRQVPALLNHHNDPEFVRDKPVEIAFGDDWGGGTSPDPLVFTASDTQLNNRVGAVSLTDPSNSDTDYRVDESVASLELNNETLREIGIVTESGRLWNHSPMPTAVAKTSDEALTISITIPTGDNS